MSSAPRKKTRGGTRAAEVSSGCVPCKPKKGRGVSSDAGMYQADSVGGRTPTTHSSHKALPRNEIEKNTMHMDEKIRRELSEPYDYPQSMQIIKRASE